MTSPVIADHDAGVESCAHRDEWVLTGRVQALRKWGPRSRRQVTKGPGRTVTPCSLITQFPVGEFTRGDAMLASFTFLVAAAAVAPVLWFVWWMSADLMASRRSRRPASA